MSVMDRLFGKQQPAPQQQQTPNPTGAEGTGEGGQPNQQNKTQDSGGSQQLATAKQVQGAPGDPNKPNGSSPLEPFADLWKDDATSRPEKKSLLGIDTKKISENAKKLNYSQLVPPELSAKALSGDANAFNEILNTVGQAGFANSMSASVALIERGAEAMHARFLENLPAEVRKHIVSDASLAANPKLNHPSVKPLLSAVQQQIQAKFPDATTQEVNKMATQYMSEVFKVMQGDEVDGGEIDESGGKKSSSQKSRTSKVPQDWGKFFDE